MTRFGDLGRPRVAVVSALASSALATCGVLGVLVGLNAAFGGDADVTGAYADEQPADPGLEARSGPPPAAPGTATPGPDADGAGAAPGPDADGTANSAAAGTATPGPDAEGDGSASAQPSDEPSAAPDVPSVEVVVLNETVRHGLADTFGDVLSAAGWTVDRTGNFRGNVPATTVYYPAGLKAEAEALEEAFPQVNRIRPAFDGIPTDKLTVILCKDYPTG